MYSTLLYIGKPRVRVFSTAIMVQILCSYIIVYLHAQFPKVSGQLHARFFKPENTIEIVLHIFIFWDIKIYEAHIYVAPENPSILYTLYSVCIQVHRIRILNDIM